MLKLPERLELDYWLSSLQERAIRNKIEQNKRALMKRKKEIAEAKEEPEVKKKVIQRVRTQRLSCCGVVEVDGISRFRNPQELLYSMYRCINQKYAGPRNTVNLAQIIFTENKRTTIGKRTANLIQKLRLGHVTKTASTLNRNSGNRIRVYIWTPNWRRTRNWGTSQAYLIKNRTNNPWEDDD